MQTTILFDSKAQTVGHYFTVFKESLNSDNYLPFNFGTNTVRYLYLEWKIAKVSFEERKWVYY